MNTIPLSSSAISAAGYDPRTGRMEIRFKRGHTYTFCGVPAYLFEGLINASSPGSYYDRHIRDRYQC